MRYTFKDLVELVPDSRRAEFTNIYEYLHKITDPKDEDIMDKVTKHFLVSKSDIKSDRKFADVVLARQLYVTTIKVCSTKTLAEVARIVNKDHATVCHAMKVMQRDYEYNAARRHKIRHFIADLNQSQQELLLDFFNERNPDILAAYSVDADRVTTPSQVEA